MTPTDPPRKRHVHYQFGRRIIERLQNGETIRYSEQREKVQEAIDGMVWCELVSVVGACLILKARLTTERTS